MRVMAIGTLGVDVLAVDLPGVADPGTVVYAPHEIETRIGGHPIDVAIDLIKLGTDPGNVAVVAAIGEGIYAEYVRSVIEEYGPDMFLQRVDGRDVGRNVVLEVQGEDRRFHLDPGANWLLDAGHVADAVADWQPDVITLRPGYTGIDLHLETALAPAGDALVLLDIMQPHPSRPAGYLDPALGRAGIVHCNELEARLATGADSVEAAVDEFFTHGVELALITAGEQGATAHLPGHRIEQPGFAVDAIDVTGSGDAFCAGFIQGLAGAMPTDPETVARLLLAGQAAGAAAATAVGCVDGVSADLVDRLVAEQGETLLQDTKIIEH